MNIRPKTVRRLLILFTAIAVVVAGLATVVYFRLKHQRAQLAQVRARGVAAFDAGDYPKAVALLSDFLGHDHDAQEHDAEAIYDYGKSRAMVPMENDRHLFESVSVLQHYLQIDPDDRRDASHLLLLLDLQTGNSSDAKRLAGQLLRKNPHDPAAMQARVVAFEAERDNASALQACHALNEAGPPELKWENEELQLMAATHKPIEQVLGRAQKLLDDHPGDPRFLVLSANAYLLAGDPARATDAVTAAARLAPADADSAIQTVQLLQQFGKFDAADAVLAGAGKKFDDVRLKRLSAQRLFEDRRLGELADLLKTLDVHSPKTDSTLLGYYAMALCEQNRKAEAQPAIDALTVRPDPTSQAWAIALHARFDAPAATGGDLVRKYQDAVARDPRNALFHFLSADALAQMGETDEATREAADASRLSPAWMLPHEWLSRAYTAGRHYRDAMREARFVLLKQSGSPEGPVAYALAWFGLRETPGQKPDPQDADKLFDLLSSIRKQWPDEPNSLPAYVTLLARRGEKDRAIEAVKSALAANPPFPESTLAALSDVSEHENLGLSETILERAEKAHGLTPGIAFARASDLYQAGKKDEALALVESAHKAHANEIPWQIAEARFKDRINAPDAGRTWVALADANPKNLAVQYAALDTPARFADREFWRRTIDRVRALTGDSGIAWQVQEAQWQLTGRPSEKDLAAVIASLGNVVRLSPALPYPHRLLADALLRTGRPEDADRAAVELTQAHDIEPTDLATTASLASVLIAQGHADRATQLADAALDTQNASPEQRLWAAQTLAQVGATDRAIAVLTGPGMTGGDEAARDTLLAALDQRVGRTEDAAALYRKLLESPAPQNVLVAGAEFFAARNDAATSERFLDRLQKLPLPAGTLELLRAHLAEVRGTPDDALAALNAAVKANPGSDRAWQELAGFHLRRGEVSAADADAVEGLKAVPGSAMLQAMRSQLARLKDLDLAGIPTLVDVVSHDPANAAAAELVKVLADERSRRAGPAEAAPAIRQIAERYPRFFPAQAVLVRRWVELGRYKDAADAARKAAEAAPNSPEPLRLLTEAQMSAGDWAAAREAAHRWRDMSAGNPLAADLAIATVDLEQRPDAPADALKQLAPYVADAAPEAQRSAALPVYCRALLRAGKPDDAARLLQPLIGNPQWRQVWMNLAAVGSPDADAAGEWLKRLIPSLPADDAATQFALAAAWERVGSRFDALPAYQAAHDVLAALVARSPSAQTWGLLATVNQPLGDLAGAEAAWRKALELRPGQPDTLNNLAYVLLLEGGADRLNEADALASRAIAANPDASTFYDTLARIRMQSGKSEEAIRNFRLALDRDPNNVEAMIGLADALQSRPADRSEARTLLNRIDAATPSAGSLPAQVRKELDRVKTALSSSL